MKERRFKPIRAWHRIIDAVYRMFHRIDLAPEDGVYRATKGKKAWYVPSGSRERAKWAFDFMSAHERFLNALREGDTVIEAGAGTGEYTVKKFFVVGARGEKAVLMER